MTTCAALGCSARRGVWLMLCAAASACVGDSGDLFPATSLATTPPEEAPTNVSDVSSPSGDVAPPAVDVASGTEVPVGNELSPPVVFDTGSPPRPSDAEGPARGDDAPADEPAPVDEAAGGPAPDDATSPPLPPSPEPPVPAAEDDSVNGIQVCARVASPLLLDFAGISDDPTRALFGDFEAVLSGGTYVYPQAPDAVAPLLGLLSDVTAGDWHIQGSVTQQSGFGLFLDCQLLDASGFEGLAFRVSGTVQSEGSITLLVGTASNEVSPAWRQQNDGSSLPSSGRCLPAQSEFDGSCNVARIEIPVSRLMREVVVPFSALTGGSPEPGVNPAEITTIAWALPSPTNLFGDVEPYGVDLRIDDIRFVEADALLP